MTAPDHEQAERLTTPGVEFLIDQVATLEARLAEAQEQINLLEGVVRAAETAGSIAESERAKAQIRLKIEKDSGEEVGQKCEELEAQLAERERALQGYKRDFLAASERREWADTRIASLTHALETVRR